LTTIRRLGQKRSYLAKRTEIGWLARSPPVDVAVSPTFCTGGTTDQGWPPADDAPAQQQENPAVGDCTGKEQVPVIAAIAAGGAAFTAGNTVPDTVAGYGTSNITGATVTALHYTLNADGTQITDAALTFQGDQTHNVVKAGFGTDALTTCTVGSYDGASTPATCSGFTQSTHDSATFNVAVTNS
jgi:hypothetical protein